MAVNIYPQSPSQPRTLTVGELIEQLSAFDLGKPVIFRSPKYGAFGSGTTYTIDSASPEHLAAFCIDHDAIEYHDHETGELIQQEAYTDHFPEWDGVVIG